MEYKRSKKIPTKPSTPLSKVKGIGQEFMKKIATEFAQYQHTLTIKGFVDYVDEIHDGGQGESVRDIIGSLVVNNRAGTCIQNKPDEDGMMPAWINRKAFNILSEIYADQKEDLPLAKQLVCWNEGLDETDASDTIVLCKSSQNRRGFGKYAEMPERTCACRGQDTCDDNGCSWHNGACMPSVTDGYRQGKAAVDVDPYSGDYSETKPDYVRDSNLGRYVEHREGGFIYIPGLAEEEEEYEDHNNNDNNSEDNDNGPAEESEESEESEAAESAEEEEEEAAPAAPAPAAPAPAAPAPAAPRRRRSQRLAKKANEKRLEEQKMKLRNGKKK